MSDGPDSATGTSPAPSPSPEAQAEERLGRKDTPEVMREIVRACGSADEVMGIDGDAGKFVTAYDEAALKVAARREAEERARLVARGGRELRRELGRREAAPRPRPAPPGPPPGELRQRALLEQARQSGGSVESVAQILEHMTRRQK